MKEQSEIQQQTEQKHPEKKHFLTLHFSHKGQEKTLHFRIRHAVAFCAAAAVLAGGAVYYAGACHAAKTELHTSQENLEEAERAKRKLEQKTEILETENSQYTENIETIQEKANELEEKVTELENVKNDLYDQVNEIDTSDASAAQVCSDMTSALEGKGSEEKTQTFTTMVSTPYGKVSSLSDYLDKMDSQFDETTVAFNSVATDVTETLAQITSVPSGMPVQGYVSSEFNPSGNGGRVHKGIDVATRHRILPITATASGTVTSAGYSSSYGYVVEIDHGNGFTTLYAHNSELLVKAGDQVMKGDTIAMAGSTGMSTGIHCHYEIRLNGVYQNPRDYF